ncbi:MAG: SAM-dependent chlorinase/fluorinase [Candidatus Sumerlaeia bacterium]|nr:SAM-dependent chlorinase/fluorinase [Candidatus Sumerlaeia bacterium]
MATPVFLLSDFGLADPFVGIMKAMILRLSPESPIVDLTHHVPACDVRHGALALEDSLPWLPAGAVVCAVVDPGVGTARSAVVVLTQSRWLVGPDNGLLAPVASADPAARFWRLRPGGVIRPDRSATFHGRDVFAPAAALLAAGNSPESIADPIPALVPLALPVAQPTADGVRLVILARDHFGNLTLNVRRHELPGLLPAESSRLVLLAAERRLEGLRRTFADVPPGEPVFYWNSADRLELAVHGGNAGRTLGLAPGDEVLLTTA